MTQPPQPPYGDQPQQPPYGEQPQQPPYGGQQQPQGAPSGYPAPQSGRGGPDSAGFFKALFDFSFKSFVTIKFAGFIFAIGLVIIGVGTLVGVIMSFIAMTESVGAGFLMLLLVIIVAPVYLILLRVSLEFYVGMIRTAQNTSQVASELENLRWDMSQKN